MTYPPPRERPFSRFSGRPGFFLKKRTKSKLILKINRPERGIDFTKKHFQP